MINNNTNHKNLNIQNLVLANQSLDEKEKTYNSSTYFLLNSIFYYINRFDLSYKEQQKNFFYLFEDFFNSITEENKYVVIDKFLLKCLAYSNKYYFDDKNNIKRKIFILRDRFIMIYVALFFITDDKNILKLSLNEYKKHLEKQNNSLKNLLQYMINDLENKSKLYNDCIDEELNFKFSLDNKYKLNDFILSFLIYYGNINTMSQFLKKSIYDEKNSNKDKKLNMNLISSDNSFITYQTKTIMDMFNFKDTDFKKNKKLTYLTIILCKNIICHCDDNINDYKYKEIFKYSSAITLINEKLKKNNNYQYCDEIINNNCNNLINNYNDNNNKINKALFNNLCENINDKLIINNTNYEKFYNKYYFNFKKPNNMTIKLNDMINKFCKKFYETIFSKEDNIDKYFTNFEGYEGFGNFLFFYDDDQTHCNNPAYIGKHSKKIMYKFIANIINKKNEWDDNEIDLDNDKNKKILTDQIKKTNNCTIDNIKNSIITKKTNMQPFKPNNKINKYNNILPPRILNRSNSPNLASPQPLNNYNALPPLYNRSNSPNLASPQPLNNYNALPPLYNKSNSPNLASPRPFTNDNALPPIHYNKNNDNDEKDNKRLLNNNKKIKICDFKTFYNCFIGKNITSNIVNSILYSRLNSKLEDFKIPKDFKDLNINLYSERLHYDNFFDNKSYLEIFFKTYFIFLKDNLKLKYPVCYLYYGTGHACSVIINISNNNNPLDNFVDIFDPYGAKYSNDKYMEILYKYFTSDSFINLINKIFYSNTEKKITRKSFIVYVSANAFPLQHELESKYHYMCMIHNAFYSIIRIVFYFSGKFTMNYVLNKINDYILSMNHPIYLYIVFLYYVLCYCLKQNFLNTNFIEDQLTRFKLYNIEIIEDSKIFENFYK